MPKKVRRKNTRSVEVDEENQSAEPKSLKDVMKEGQRLTERYAQLPIGTVISSKYSKYKVVEEVSATAFGYTYLVKELTGPKQRLHLRTEAATNKPHLWQFRNLATEVNILSDILDLKNPQRGFKNIITACSTGCFKGCYYLIFQELGPTLHDIMNKQLKSAFSLSTALRVSYQSLNAIKALHSLGYVHRYIRPTGFAVGIHEMSKRIYMMDLGFPFQYRDPKTKRIKKPRPQVRMFGLSLYSSRNFHLEKELSRRDDIESWFYMCLVFFKMGILPWRKDNDPTTIRLKKQMLLEGGFKEVYKKTNMELCIVAKYLKDMSYAEEPDYEYVFGALHRIKLEKNVDFSKPFDWQVPLKRKPKASNTPKRSKAKTPVKKKPKSSTPSKTPSKSMDQSERDDESVTLETQEENTSTVDSDTEDPTSKETATSASDVETIFKISQG